MSEIVRTGAIRAKLFTQANSLLWDSLRHDHPYWYYSNKGKFVPNKEDAIKPI